VSIVVQLLINSIIAGSIYALIASGFSLIYSVAKFMHFAHGAVVTVSAFILFFFAGMLKFPFWLSAILTIIFAALFGLLMNLLCYRPMRKRKATNAVLLIASLAMFILFQSLMIAVFGADIKTVRLGQISTGLNVFGGIITELQIIIVLVSVILLVLLWLFMKKTRLGKAMRAVADNKEVAQTVGINPEKIYNITFMIGSAIAGIAAVLIALEQNVEPNMGFSLIIKGFTGAIIGGIHMVPGAVLGSYLLGLVENFGIWFLPSGYKDAIAFVLLFIFLLIRPQGILGIKRGVNNK